MDSCRRAKATAIQAASASNHSRHHVCSCTHACMQPIRVCVQIMVIEGLHPFYDERVRELCDFKIYLDISGGCRRQWPVAVV